MNYIRIQPHPQLNHLVDCYWVIDGEAEAGNQKIIPDGYTELIFHYADPYRAQIDGVWQTQSPYLLAGQISNYFYLHNTGNAGIVAIKFKPAALTQLFGLHMAAYTDNVVGLETVPAINVDGLVEKIIPFKGEESLKEALDNYLLALSVGVTAGPVNAAVDLVLNANGMVTVKEMADAAAVGERQLERLFKRYVGLSPKYYARIIRFNYIFQLIQDKNTPWADIVYQSGYYDQSHFIRNFKAFTGEDPTAYYFDEKNMANFFLKKE